MYHCVLFILIGMLGFSSALLINYTEQKSSGVLNSDPKQVSKIMIKGVWISYLELQEFPNRYEINQYNYRKFIEDLYDNCVSHGMNHVFVHVRPFADALYPSDYFPWSHIITGQQGKNPGFDPMKIMIEEAHKRELKFHAWINPYRVNNIENRFKLDKTSNISIWMNHNDNRNVIQYNQQNYLNPSKISVQEYIIKGIKEIIENYPVDGIHFDDYFYPSFNKENIYNSFDYIEYNKYRQSTMKRNKSTMSLPDWRRNNVSVLVNKIYGVIQDHNENYKKKIIFGISPVGNLDCLINDYQYYVDIHRFVNKNGYIDYICPQIYWGFKNPEAPFDKVLNRWYKLCKDTNVDLYVGLPVYKIGTKDYKYEKKEFKDSKVIDKMIKKCKKKNIKGLIYYRYDFLNRL